MGAKDALLACIGLVAAGLCLFAMPGVCWADTIPIASIEELQKIGNDPAYPLTGNYALMQDIDASVTAGWNGGAGFAPIGNDISPFTGTFDGQNHVVSRLAINRPVGDYAGLFGFVGSRGVVKNVGILGATVAGSSNVGELAGSNSGTMSQCYATGTALGTGSVGGLVGVNMGSDYPPLIAATVTQCYAAVRVSSTGAAGGLVGTNYEGAVTQSYAAGAVSLTGSGGGGFTAVGGLVGWNSGTVTQCCATGMVSSAGEEDSVGGLVGRGAMTDIVNASYWDTQTSGQNVAVYGGIGEPTAAMMIQATFVGWDFQNVWGIDEGKTYPLLRFAPPPLHVDFAANPQMGAAPLTVVFTYWASVPENDIVDWEWHFGDDETSHEKNPVHTYTNTMQNIYTVSLTLTALQGTIVATKPGLITVTNAVPMSPWLQAALITVLLLVAIRRIEGIAT